VEIPVLIPRGELDCPWSAILRAVIPGGTIEARPDEVWCLSVRSGLDLLLRHLQLPRGALVAMSAITIPEMIRLVELHGLVPYPLDLDPQTLAPDPDSICLHPDTVLVIVAHLFGSRMDLTHLARACNSRGVFLIEDCAQAGIDRAGEKGDFCLYSLGPIKSPSALGGGLLTTPHRDRAKQLRQLLAGDEVQSSRQYLHRCLKLTMLKALGRPMLFTFLVHLMTWLGWSYEEILIRATRGFPGPPETWINRLRRQPSAALRRVMNGVLNRDRASRVESRVARSRALTAGLPSNCAIGTRAHRHQHWVLPVMSQRPEDLLQALRRAGFDATRKASSLTVVQPPHPDFPDAVRSRQLLSGIVYIPQHPALHGPALARLISLIRNMETPVTP
jgi:dTDP-4-amino-4,6-dideoxygalactose transaminase